MNTTKIFHHRFTIFLILSSLLLFAQSSNAQQLPAIQWQKCFGGNDVERGFSLIQTTDNGYAIAGYTESTDGDVIGHHGGIDYRDAWVVKIGAAGNFVWQKSLGGMKADGFNAILQTPDDGYIAAGFTASNDFDVSGNHGSFPSRDVWVVKLDSVGNIQWQKCYGGTDDEIANAMVKAFDDGYIIAGYTQSTDGDITASNGGQDLWVAKISSSGNLLWQKSYGGSGNEQALSIIQTLDRCYAISGYTESNDGIVNGSHGGRDGWVMKITTSGDLLWQYTFGGTDVEQLNSIIQLPDSSYVAAGSTNSFNGEVAPNHGGSDVWIVKLNSAGNLLWQKKLGRKR